MPSGFGSLKSISYFTDILQLFLLAIAQYFMSILFDIDLAMVCYQVCFLL